MYRLAMPLCRSAGLSMQQPETKGTSYLLQDPMKAMKDAAVEANLVRTGRNQRQLCITSTISSALLISLRE